MVGIHRDLEAHFPLSLSLVPACSHKKVVEGASRKGVSYRGMAAAGGFHTDPGRKCSRMLKQTAVNRKAGIALD